MPDQNPWPTIRVVSIKQFTYRGVAEQWSNSYHFDGTPPATDAAWLTAVTALSTKERAFLPASTTALRYVAYLSHATHIEYAIGDVGASFGLGTMAAISGGIQLPGDAAFTVRARVVGRWTDKGKPVYCRKFFHAPISTVTPADTLATAQSTAAKTALDAMVAGTGMTLGRWVHPDGGTLAPVEVSPLVTTRTLKRRSKRPLD